MLEFSNEQERKGGYNMFGKLNNRIITTNCNNLKVGDTVTLINTNCEFSFDNVTGEFEDNLLYCYTVDLELIEKDLSNFDADKSNNGGGYAFAYCKIKKIYDKSY